MKNVGLKIIFNMKNAVLLKTKIIFKVKWYP